MKRHFMACACYNKKKQLDMEDLDSFIKIQGWLQGAGNNTLLVVNKPTFLNGMYVMSSGGMIVLKDISFPNLTAESDPIEAEIYIRPLK